MREDTEERKETVKDSENYIGEEIEEEDKDKDTINNKDLQSETQKIETPNDSSQKIETPNDPSQISSKTSTKNYLLELSEKYKYTPKHDSFIIPVSEAILRGAASMYIRLLKFRLKLNDCQNQGFILLNVEKLFKKIDLAYFFYKHPLLEVYENSFYNPYADLLYSYQIDSLKRRFFRNKERMGLLVWDNFDSVVFAFEYYKRRMGLRGIQNIQIKSFFLFMQRCFIPQKLLTEFESQSKLDLDSKNSKTHISDQDFNSKSISFSESRKGFDDEHTEGEKFTEANGGNERQSKKSAEKIDILGRELEGIFDQKDFYNLEEALKPVKICEFVDLNLDEEDRAKENEIIFLESLIFTSLDFAKTMKLWSKYLKEFSEKENLVVKVSDSEEGEKDVTGTDMDSRRPGDNDNENEERDMDLLVKGYEPSELDFDNSGENKVGQIFQELFSYTRSIYFKLDLYSHKNCILGKLSSKLSKLKIVLSFYSIIISKL